MRRFELVSLGRRSIGGRTQLRYRLKLLPYEVPDNNSPERIAVRKAWCEKFLADGGNLADAVHVDKGGFICHVTRRLGKAAVGFRPCHTRPTRKGRNFTLIVAHSQWVEKASLLLDSIGVPSELIYALSGKALGKMYNNHDLPQHAFLEYEVIQTSQWAKEWWLHRVPCLVSSSKAFSQI